MLGSVALRLFAGLAPVMGGRLFSQYNVAESLLNKWFLRLNEDSEMGCMFSEEPQDPGSQGGWNIIMSYSVGAEFG